MKEGTGNEAGAGMHDRRDLMQALDHYLPLYPEETNKIERIQELVTGHSDCFERTCMPGHITGSAWIVSPDCSKYLMTRHRFLNRWLQLGGHSDGCARPHLVALREAEEESGLTGFGLYREPQGLVPLDVDIHAIPARGNEPEHAHYDLRYLLIASSEKPLKISDESHDLGWFGKKELVEITDEESVLRMLRKGEDTLARGNGEFVYDFS